jgi:hypothetical protein
MQRCNIIYYSKIYWRLNMFLAAYRSSSGAPKCICRPLVYIPMWWPAVVQAVQPGQRPVTTWVYKPEAANADWRSWWQVVWRSKHVEPWINSGIMNSITRLHLVGFFYWFAINFYMSQIKGEFSLTAFIDKLIDGPPFWGEELRSCERNWCYLNVERKYWILYAEYMPVII